ncbi:MAG: hypothetical protein NUW01_17565 [Gemmatimonadaceae bacterium]|nr:hypothetical protein [Gemmatimonadaceae bacterium]
MSNTTLTADIIAKEAVMILENECLMAKLCYRGYEEEFDKKINGYKVGEIVSIRRPTDFTVRDGKTAVIQDVVEGKIPVTVDKQKGIDFKFSSSDLTLQIGELSDRVIKPAMIQLANQIDVDVMGLYNEIPKHVIIPSGGIDSYADFALAPTLMDSCAIPQADRSAVLCPTDYWALLGSQTALFITEAARGAYRNANLGMIGGVDTYMSQNVPTHTPGTRVGTDLADLAVIDGYYTWAAAKDSTSVTFHIDGAAANEAGYWLKGDIFTVADLYDVNPVTKARLSHLKQFVVMSTSVTTSNSEADLSIWPPMILSGAQKNCELSTGAITGNVITYVGTASTPYRQNLFFHKNAFALTVVPMVSPPGAMDVGRRTYKGISVRVIPYYDGTNDDSNWRLDVLYGVDVVDSRLAVRASLMATVS